MALASSPPLPPPFPWHLQSLDMPGRCRATETTWSPGEVHTDILRVWGPGRVQASTILPGPPISMPLPRPTTEWQGRGGGTWGGDSWSRPASPRLPASDNPTSGFSISISPLVWGGGVVVDELIPRAFPRLAVPGFQAWHRLRSFPMASNPTQATTYPIMSHLDRNPSQS